ncbi:uncharacterized protein BDZ83DRAFT_645171 [Colletotrichum acutatum]|uniref:Chromo domain-containing protein n=1 Tax=Glomerella acutata TaxID=27357 RepID=A0AAD8U4G4_GLOAC|nr:uncharacterized protein BDZ83DRAFT_645171 [Colletotrichum acutatum]KAK1702805.1 hypothetical protein BDZ83DRAFT_645171 [Colletotrichum acutatum]
MPVDPSLLAEEGYNDVPPRSAGSLPQSAVSRQLPMNEDINETFTVDQIPGRWGRNLSFLRWMDGTCSWEPRENLLDDNLIETFEEEYEGSG